MKIKASKRGRVIINLTVLESELLINLAAGEDSANLTRKILELLPERIKQAEQYSYEIDQKKNKKSLTDVAPKRMLS